MRHLDRGPGRPRSGRAPGNVAPEPLTRQVGRRKLSLYDHDVSTLSALSLVLDEAGLPSAADGANDLAVRVRSVLYGIPSYRPLERADAARLRVWVAAAGGCNEPRGMGPRPTDRTLAPRSLGESCEDLARRLDVGPSLGAGARWFVAAVATVLVLSLVRFCGGAL